MNTSVSNTSPAPPSIIRALRAGFDAISSKVSILLFPITVDLFIWMGPHIGVKKILNDFISQVNRAQVLEDSTSIEFFESNIDVLTQLASRINIIALLRTYPVGIPSLMAGTQPIETPLETQILLEAESLVLLVLISILLIFFGLTAGTLYYQFVSHIALFDRVDIREGLNDLPRALLQIISFVFILLGLIIFASIPASCLLSIIALSGFSIAQFLIFLYIGFLLWLIFPLLLTPQIIIMRKMNVFAALKNSLKITRMTLPTTGMLFAVIFLISEGLDILWRIPEEDSWLTLIGILGHSFITTSLLASTFIYYRDAERWTQSIFNKISLSSMTK